MKNTWLITGGSRSGKSRYALDLAAKAKKPFYIATGWAGDGEMADRIKKHKLERGPHWTTIEAKTDLVTAIKNAAEQQADYIIVDCITFWISNLMIDEKNIDENVKQLIDNLPESIQTIFVTNEVGCGIVPENKLAREFRDIAGRANQHLAAAVDNVVLTVCGQPLKIK